MSRQSSLVEDRISSDEDEFQEERSGRFHKGQQLFRPHSFPTTKATFHCGRAMSCYAGHEYNDNADDVDGPTASGNYSVSRVTPEPDLIREILARKYSDSRRRNRTQSSPSPSPSSLGSYECGTANPKMLEEAFKPRHNAVRNSRSTPVLVAGPSPSNSSSLSKERVCGRGRRRRRHGGKKFKLRSCLIQSCITH